MVDVFFLAIDSVKSFVCQPLTRFLNSTYITHIHITYYPHCSVFLSNSAQLSPLFCCVRQSPSSFVRCAKFNLILISSDMLNHLIKYLVSKNINRLLKKSAENVVCKFKVFTILHIGNDINCIYFQILNSHVKIQFENNLQHIFFLFLHCHSSKFNYA